MADDRWISDEPRLPALARRVLARAAHRPVLVGVVAALIACAVVGSRAIRPPAYEASLHFRIAEGSVSDPRHSPRPPSGIRDYIRNVAMSRDRVERILTEHPSFGSTLTRNREQTIERFREDVDIEVSRNYFILDWAEAGAPRSARVAISLRALDGTEALEVLREIGRSILDEQGAFRRSQVEGSRAFVDVRVREARARSQALQRKLLRLQRDAARDQGARGTPTRTEIAALRGEVAVATDRLLQLERLASSVRLSEAAEREDLGLRFELFDEGVVPFGVRFTPLKLLAFGALAFTFSLLLTALVVGAFDDRVYAREDLELRGLPVFGALARFPGDDVWTYKARGRPRKES